MRAEEARCWLREVTASSLAMIGAIRLSSQFGHDSARVETPGERSCDRTTATQQLIIGGKRGAEADGNCLLAGRQ